MEKFFACFARNMLHHYFCYIHAKVYRSTDSNHNCFSKKNVLETKYWMVNEGRKRPLASQQNVKS